MTAVPGRALQEMRRQNAVVLYGLSGAEAKTVDTDELDSIAETLAAFLQVSYAGVHILDGDLQVTLGASEVPPTVTIPRDDSICAAVLADHRDAQVIEIPDATDEPRLRDNPFVDGERGWVRFYAATPLRTASGMVLGTLCVVDHEPRTLDDRQRHLLLHLGYAVVHVLERHRRRTRPDG